MHKLTLTFLLLVLLNSLQAQHKVSIHITHFPAYHTPEDSIFIAGSFNNWNPGNGSYKFSKTGASSYSINLLLPKGKHEYKLTRGNWSKNESAGSRVGLANRILQVTSDTAIYITVTDWADHFPQTPKRSTANKYVKIIETAFYIPQLNRHRRIWIYLPESYATARKRYPVLYMHDGQNIFEDTTSYSGEWGVDEALDTLGKQTREMIVVAIDNGGDKRLNEYSPYDMERFGKGEGDAYVDFLIKTLRPYINKNYRTKKCGKHNYVAGSSMGGLISLYALLKYPKKWGGAGVFSPAFWIVPELKNVVAEKAKRVKGKIYFYAGKQESESMVPDMLAVFTQMNQLSKSKMETVIRSEGAHTEATWRKEFPLFYKWLK